jgi:tetratricopeptide (TPR) repeat protein/HEAT repeat protein
MPRVRQAVVVICALLLLTGPARAQDDWSVQKNPFDARVVQRYKALLEKNPDDEAVLRKLMELYGRYSTTSKLVLEYQAKRQKAPDHAAYALILGHLHLRGGRLDEALSSYEAAAQLQPQNPSAWLSLAEGYRRAQKPRDAMDGYEKALKLARGLKEKRAILRTLADLAVAEQDLARARLFLEEYVLLDASEIAGRLELADVLGKQGLHDEALAEYRATEQRLRTDPAKRIEVLVRMAGALDALGREDDAITTYRQAAELLQKGHYLQREITTRVIDVYRRRQDLRGLVSFYEKQWPAASRGHFEWDVLAGLYEEIGDQDKALAAYRKAVQASPSELDTQRRLIALLSRAGRDDEATEQVEALVRVAPGEPRFQIELAELYLKKGDKEKALERLRQVAQHFPDDPGVHAALADLYARWGEADRALKEYEVLVRIEPNEEAHLVNLGEQLFQRGDKAKAVEIWKKIATTRTAEAYARLADVYAEHDMGSEAIEMYLKAVGLRPQEAVLYRGLATILERQKRDDEAVAAWEKVMELAVDKAQHKPLRREARTRIVSIRSRQSGMPLLRLVRDWSRRFEGKPPDLDSAYFLAEAYLKLGRSEDAQRTLEKILALDGADLDAMHQLVSVYRAMHKFPEAIVLLKRLAEAQPGHEREYFSQIAELEMALYHDAEAIVFAEKALEKSPNDAQAQEKLAEILDKKNEVDKAIAAYQRAMALNPKNAKTPFALARLYLRRGREHDAALLYREIVRRGTDEETVRIAARKAIDLEEYLGTLGELDKHLAPLAFLFSNKPIYRRMLVEVHDRYVPPLVRRAQRGDAWAEKELLRLGEHGLKPLLEALGDGADPSQQKIAAQVLGYLGNKNAALPLLKLGTDVPRASLPVGKVAAGLEAPQGADMELRVQAIVSAGRLEDPRTVPVLLPLMKSREVALRQAAAWAIGRIKDPRGVKALWDAMGDPTPAVQALACLGLANAEERKAMDRVSAVMRDPRRQGEVRSACAYALGLARSAPHTQALLDTLAEGNDDVQEKAAWALSRIGDKKTIPSLLALYFAKRPAVREKIRAALTVLLGAASMPARLPLVVVESNKISYRQLVGELATFADSSPVPATAILGYEREIADGILAALRRHHDVVVAVLSDLDAREDGLGLGALTAHGETLRDDEQTAVATTLRAVGQKLADRVYELSLSPDAQVQRLALHVLAKTQDPRTAARIAAALEDKDLGIRMGALTSAECYVTLTAHKPEPPAAREVVTAVTLRTTRAPSWQERTLALDVLGKLGPAVDAPLLVPSLEDPSGFVREAAARALGRLAQRESSSALLESTHDDLAEVRLAAVLALLAIGDPSADPRLAELAEKDPDPRVRKAAHKDLRKP